MVDFPNELKWIHIENKRKITKNYENRPEIDKSGKI